MTCVAISGFPARIDVAANNRRISVNGDFSRLVGGDGPYESREIMEIGVSRLGVVCRQVEDKDEGATRPNVAPVSSSSRFVDVSGGRTGGISAPVGAVVGVSAPAGGVPAPVGGQLSVGGGLPGTSRLGLGQEESVRILSPLIDIHYIKHFYYILIQIRPLIEGKYFLILIS